ncbi:MAG: hypothetical protein AABZ74_15500 [Cyanobacteriota bacterium]
MNNKVILKISNSVYKIIETQNDIEKAEYLLLFGCDMNIQEFFKLNW